MLLKDEITGDLRRIEREIRVSRTDSTQVFTWKSALIPCVPTTLGRGVQIDAFGNVIQIDLTLIVRCNEFLTADSTLVSVDSELYTVDNDRAVPITGYTLTFRGKLYRIISAKEDPLRSHFSISLADPASNQ